MTKQYDIVEFKRIDDRLVPDHKLAKYMMVSPMFFDWPQLEIQPLTLSRFVRAVVVNFYQINIWRTVRLLWKIGFLDTMEGNKILVSDWRWDFWNICRRRKNRN